MKTFIKNFLLGICIGTTIFVYSIILSGILIGDITPDMYSEYALYFFTTLWLAIFIGIGLTFADNNKNMEINKREKILKTSITIITILIVVFLFTFLISIITQFAIGLVFSFLIIVSLLLWLVGAKMNYKIVKEKIDK